MVEQSIHLVSEEQEFSEKLSHWLGEKFGSITIKKVGYQPLEQKSIGINSGLVVFVVTSETHIDILKEFKNIRGEVLIIVFAPSRFLLHYSDLLGLGITAVFDSELPLNENVYRFFDKALTYEKLEMKRKQDQFSSILPELRQQKDFIYRDEKMMNLMLEIYKFAKTDYNILLLGETGVGKTIIAKAIHDLSPRNNAIFHSLNIGKVSANFAISDLFGHVKGAYTGSTGSRKGAFEMAKGGTLFIDEVGNMASVVQNMLLDVIEMPPTSRKFFKMGADHDNNNLIEVNVRVITATNRNIKDENSGFHHDLFQRLGKTFTIPPLRERLEDIPPLIEYFLRKYSSNKKLVLDEDAFHALMEYSWPGNIRELETVIKNACVSTIGSKIYQEDLMIPKT